jgi:hypothetical protein
MLPLEMEWLWRIRMEFYRSKDIAVGLGVDGSWLV